MVYQTLDRIVSQMNKEQEYIFQNGSSCSAFAWLGTAGTSNANYIYVKTDDESLVGTQRTIIRGCDVLSNLLELNFYVNVTSNSAPVFDTDVQTQWNLNVGDSIPYKLPTYHDPEGNDASDVYINSMENQQFPPFVTYDNTTKTIYMKPNSTLYQGRTYYFSIVLKERHSDFMMNVYYMTVKMSGDPIDPNADPYANYTRVSYNLV